MEVTQEALEDMKVNTVAEVAAVLRVSKMSVYRLLKSGELESIRVGRMFRVKEKSLLAYIDRVTIGGSNIDDYPQL